MNKSKNKDVKPSLEISQKELQEFMETLDPKRNIQDLAATAAEIIAYGTAVKLG